MYDLKILGRNIKRYRQLKGLMQQELAKKVGLTKDTISKVELGKQENIGVKYLILIQEELDVAMQELFMEHHEEKVIKLVISDQNARNLKRIFNEIVSRFTKKEGK